VPKHLQYEFYLKAIKFENLEIRSTTYKKDHIMNQVTNFAMKPFEHILCNIQQF